MFSGNRQNGLRGPQFEAAWCDELCKWRYPQETWDMLQFGLRLGRKAAPDRHDDTAPDAFAKAIMEDPGNTVRDKVKTTANATIWP